MYLINGKVGNHDCITVSSLLCNLPLSKQEIEMGCATDKSFDKINNQKRNRLTLKNVDKLVCTADDLTDIT